MQQDGSIMTTHTTSVTSLQKQLNWPSLSVRRLQSRLVLFYKICQQNIAIPIPPYLQIPLRTTRHTSNINENSYRYRHIQIQLLSPNYHRLEFTATQSVCDSNGAVLQGGRTLYPNRPKPTQTDLNQPNRPEIIAITLIIFNSTGLLLISLSYFMIYCVRYIRN